MRCAAPTHRTWCKMDRKQRAIETLKGLVHGLAAMIDALDENSTCRGSSIPTAIRELRQEWERLERLETEKRVQITVEVEHFSSNEPITVIGEWPNMLRNPRRISI